MNNTRSWSLINIETHRDERGSLSVVQNDDQFDIKRIYYLHNCLPGHNRGAHAHIELKQIILSVSGKCNITLDDGFRKEKFLLDDPTVGLQVSNMVWRDINDLTKDSVLLVLANQEYLESDYIRDYDDYIRRVRGL